MAVAITTNSRTNALPTGTSPKARITRTQKAMKALFPLQFAEGHVRTLGPERFAHLWQLLKLLVGHLGVG